MDASVSVVAGCLFEVSLPGDAGARWQWADPTRAVSLLAEDVRQGRHRFRFRAEAEGAAAGCARLRFRRSDGAEAEVVIQVAPEHLPGDDR